MAFVWKEDREEDGVKFRIIAGSSDALKRQILEDNLSTTEPMTLTIRSHLCTKPNT